MSSERPRHLARRDYLLLPLISLATVAVLAGALELYGRIFWAEKLDNDCSYYDQEYGWKYHPNCTTQWKIAEGPWVMAHYNDCGYRNPESCHSRPPGSLRVVVVGSSVSGGFPVSYPETFAARASAALTRLCGRQVEFQNMGGAPPDWGSIYNRFDEALELKADAIVTVVGPYDIKVNTYAEITTSVPESPALVPAQRVSLVEQAASVLRVSRASVIL
jgi:hypothetical protein